MAVFYNAVLIPKSKNMAKSMADFSDYPAILFAMFRRGSISDPSGVDMAPCRSVAILLNREAGVFFRESPPSALRVESVYNHSNTIESVQTMTSPQGNARKGISPPGSTYAGQSSLPRLPIPTLQETLNRFPDVVSAIVNKKDRIKCQEEITKLLKTDGPVLQQLLMEYEQKGREEGNVGSFVEEFWTDAYLTPDSSVVMNLNPFFVLEVCPPYS